MNFYKRIMLSVLACVFALGSVVIVGSKDVFANSNLCSGFTDCANKGYQLHGYNLNYNNSYWKAYAGHNCTNYVGYMLTQNGDPGHNVAMGDAATWDNTISSHPSWGYGMNGTPAVGSIAQWEVSSISPSGHVAYVEAVSASGGVTTITISEDNYASGPYSWRTITSNSSAWPTRFLHIKDLGSAPLPSGGFGGVGSATYMGSDSLYTGQQLHAGQYIVSEDGIFVLIMQGDGNLVIYGAGGSAAKWNSGTGGNPGAFLGMQGDGNMVVYSQNNVPLWNAATTDVARLSMQNDGNLVSYTSSNQPRWNSGTILGSAGLTSFGSEHLTNGQQLPVGKYLRSADGRYWLTLQGDGNLVLYGPGYHALWNTGTGGNSNAFLGVQNDGNIVLYSANTIPLWNTGTTSAVFLGLQPDGNLVARDLNGDPVWSSGTGGQI